MNGTNGKKWNGVDIIYEWSKYDAKSIRFASYLRVKTGSNCTKIRYGQYENDGRKSGVMKIIRYGPYVKSGCKSWEAM